MRRRQMLTLLGGAVAGLPLAARAQPGRRRLIGVLAGTENDRQGQLFAAAFNDELRRLGWRNGDNAHLEYRWAAGQPDLMRTYAAELVALQPDVIACTATPTLVALRNATNTVPVVFVMVSDPVALGQVASMARPGGNVTGFMPFEPSLGGKWVGLLKEVDPRLTHVVLVFNPDTAANAPGFVQHANAAAAASQILLASAPVHSDGDIERAIADAASEPGGGVVVLSDPYAFAHRRLIVAVSMQHRLPVMAPFLEFTMAGALVSYGVDVIDEIRRAAGYVDRILRGEKPGELPVQLPVRYQLGLNLKTARALGLDITPALLARADEVVE